MVDLPRTIESEGAFAFGVLDIFCFLEDQKQFFCFCCKSFFLWFVPPSSRERGGRETREAGIDKNKIGARRRTARHGRSYFTLPSGLPISSSQRGACIHTPALRRVSRPLLWRGVATARAVDQNTWLSRGGGVVTTFRRSVCFELLLWLGFGSCGPGSPPHPSYAWHVAV